jgi:hypothetical protein
MWFLYRSKNVKKVPLRFIFSRICVKKRAVACHKLWYRCCRIKFKLTGAKKFCIQLVSKISFFLLGGFAHSLVRQIFLLAKKSFTLLTRYINNYFSTDFTIIIIIQALQLFVIMKFHYRRWPFYSIFQKKSSFIGNKRVIGTII